jgi:hypothetical protein
MFASVQDKDCDSISIPRRGYVATCCPLAERARIPDRVRIPDTVGNRPEAMYRTFQTPYKDWWLKISRLSEHETNVSCCFELLHCNFAHCRPHTLV